MMTAMLILDNQYITLKLTGFNIGGKSDLNRPMNF